MPVQERFRPLRFRLYLGRSSDSAPEPDELQAQSFQLSGDFIASPRCCILRLSELGYYSLEGVACYAGRAPARLFL